MTSRPLAYVDPGRLEMFSHHSPRTTYPEESHDTLQVCIPFAGARYDVIRQSETGQKIVQQLGARDVLVLPAGQAHIVDWQRPAHIVSLQMSSSFISEALELPKLDLKEALVLRNPWITAAAHQLRMELREASPLPTVLGALATLIAHEVSRAAINAKEPQIRKTIEPLTGTQADRVARYIGDHLDKPLSVDELAKLAGLSHWHFIRRFQVTEGMSPHAHITQLRLQRARELLARSDLSITAIALEVGMSHSHFSRLFLSTVGVSPTEFRRQMKT